MQPYDSFFHYWYSNSQIEQCRDHKQPRAHCEQQHQQQQEQQQNRQRGGDDQNVSTTTDHDHLLKSNETHQKQASLGSEFHKTPTKSYLNQSKSTGLSPLAAQLSVVTTDASLQELPYSHGSAPEQKMTMNSNKTSTDSIMYHRSQTDNNNIRVKYGHGGGESDDKTMVMPHQVGPLGAGAAHFHHSIDTNLGINHTKRHHFATSIDASLPYIPGMAIIEKETMEKGREEGFVQNYHNTARTKGTSPPTTTTQSTVTPLPYHRNHPYLQQNAEPDECSHLSSLDEPSCAGHHRRGMTPMAVLGSMNHLLSHYERTEILDYKEVWFVGRAATSKIQASYALGRPNAGFDNEQGEYSALPGDHIAYRYEILSQLGMGSFGKVLKCLDHATGATIALKVIRNKRKFQKQAQIEWTILSTLAQADPSNEAGIVRIIDSFNFRSHMCMTFELLGANLYDHIKSRNFVGMDVASVKSVVKQTLTTLVFLGRFGYIHCDIKPENLVLVSNSSLSKNPSKIKVIDFGSSCRSDQRVYTYIQSRFYRAPEVILGIPYGPPIDIWSLACVMVELLVGMPLFPGEDESEQIACICEYLGLPPRSLLRDAPRAKLFFDTRSGMLLFRRPNSQGKVHRVGARTLSMALQGHGDPALLDFLHRCLQWDPEERMTPQQALMHPWIAREKINSHGGRFGPLGAAVLL